MISILCQSEIQIDCHHEWISWNFGMLENMNQTKLLLSASIYVHTCKNSKNIKSSLYYDMYCFAVVFSCFILLLGVFGANLSSEVFKYIITYFMSVLFLDSFPFSFILLLYQCLTSSVLSFLYFWIFFCFVIVVHRYYISMKKN